ncbi:uncharacterized protein LOC141633256 [Silene latifolia]|uniref:uncharacterized protein LOC141633256 n=1 Tax=Silene latifolia TaxID=37657 RepID=UPI003D7889DC
MIFERSLHAGMTDTNLSDQVFLRNMTSENEISQYDSLLWNEFSVGCASWLSFECLIGNKMVGVGEPFNWLLIWNVIYDSYCTIDKQSFELQIGDRMADDGALSHPLAVTSEQISWHQLRSSWLSSKCSQTYARSVYLCPWS